MKQNKVKPQPKSGRNIFTRSNFFQNWGGGGGGYSWYELATLRIESWP
jgi:hypothetical protein